MYAHRPEWWKGPACDWAGFQVVESGQARMNDECFLL